MVFEKRLKLLLDLHHIIKSKRSGSYSKIGEILHLSKSGVRHLIEVLQGLGAEIEYDPRTKTHYYTNDFSFDLKLGERGDEKDI